jgi:hypothetical protein
MAARVFVGDQQREVERVFEADLRELSGRG